MISFFRLLIGIVHLLLLPFLSALVLCVILYASGLADRLPILVWLAAAPLLYFLWLVIFLTFSAIQTQIVSRLFPKPRRTSITGDRFSFAGLFLIYYYQRAFQVWNLPLTSCLLRVPYMRELLLLSYAPHIHVGRNSLLWGYVYDPDLAEIGDGAVIGGRSAIVPHMLTSKPDGEYVYACAPIKIGSHAVIGGEAWIAMGVTIGDDAVVEPCSNVLPFTNIPPGEVWGGNPAVFLRKRMDVVLSSSNQQNVYKTDAGVDSANCKIDTDEIIRRFVAEALNLPLDKVHSNLSSNNCADWDSLGQLIISAAIYDRFGIYLTADQAFQIRSMDAIRQLVRSKITTLSTQQPEA